VTTNRKKDLLAIAVLLLVLVLVFAKILFTGKVVRAPDITSEFIWTVRHFKEMGFFDLFKTSLHPTWDWLTNGGTSEGGGTLSLQLLYYRNLLFWLLPLPANISWFMVLHLFFGGVGTYLYCRVIGAGAFAAFAGGLLFALAPEQASLINAGHAQKIATISFAPWAFYCLERGFLSRRLIWFLATGLVLAIQFFNMHWQIAYYTCLGIGLYGGMRMVGELVHEPSDRWMNALRLGALNISTVLFFLAAVAISLVPLADWSKETTRGVQSGANQGKGGLQVEEAMSWSLPPEEVASLVVPGLFGFSRQEGVYDTAAIRAYYWGRMVFTQTSDYMGLLPWLLLPVVMFFKRDRYTWIALVLVSGGILFSMGKYTPVYWWLYEHFPGVNHFRVPKMMLFISSFGLAVLTARGIQTLFDVKNHDDYRMQRSLAWVWGGVLILVMTLGGLLASSGAGLALFTPLIFQPNRFASGVELVTQRWQNILIELGIAASYAIAYAVILWAFVRGRGSAVLVAGLLVIVLMFDLARVDSKFMILQDLPANVQSRATPTMVFLQNKLKGYRVLVVDGTDPMQYVIHGLPVMFTSNPVQVQRWQDFLEGFRFDSAMPDMMNVKYLIYQPQQYERDKAVLGKHFLPVYLSPDGTHLVLENTQVMPKAWLVSATELITTPEERVQTLRSPAFEPRQKAIVEQPAQLPASTGGTALAGSVVLKQYQPNMLTFVADASASCLMVVGEKFHNGWKATVDGKPAGIVPVNHILRGVYLTPGKHTVEFRFDPLPFKVGKWLTLGSFLLFGVIAVREWWFWRRSGSAS